MIHSSFFCRVVGVFFVVLFIWCSPSDRSQVDAYLLPWLQSDLRLCAILDVEQPLITLECKFSPPGCLMAVDGEEQDES